MTLYVWKEPNGVSLKVTVLLMAVVKSWSNALVVQLAAHSMKARVFEMLVDSCCVYNLSSTNALPTLI